MLLSVLAIAQSGPRITGVEPTTSKVGDTLIVRGESLSDGSMEGVVLFNDGNGESYPTEIVDRADDQITVTVPDVEPATYSLALQIQGVIYTEPVQVTVE